MATPAETSFTIRELTGDKRKIELAARALPYRPIKFTGSQRSEVTWYAGSPIGTAQVFGASEKPSTFNGMWKDRFLRSVTDLGVPTIPTAIAEVNGVQVDDAMQLVNIVDDVRRKGQLCEVTWDEIIRHGILTEFEQTWDRRQDVAWSATFDFISQGDVAPAAVLPNSGRSFKALSALLDNLQAMRVAIQSEAASALADPAFINSASDFADQVGAAAQDFQDALSAGTDLTIDSATMARRQVSSLHEVTIQAAALAALASTTPSAALFGMTDLSSEIPTDGEVAVLDLFTCRITSAARKTRRDAARAQVDLSRQASPDLLDVVVARQGQDMRDVSTSAYGVPDLWRDLCAYNGVVDSLLSAGQVVLVPLLTKSQRSGAA